MDITKLPFMKGFQEIVNYSLSDQDLIYKSIQQGPLDLDKMDVLMSPGHYLGHFSTPLAVLRLSCHVPLQKRTFSEEMDEIYEDWLLLAESNHQVWIEPYYKEDFFKELKKWRTVQPAKSSWVSSYGSAFVPVSMIVHCLRTIGCRTIRYRAYGQKLPLVQPFYNGQCPPSDNGHPHSKFNTWDIGITFKSPFIFLFKPTLGMSKDMSVYPMVCPGSRDFGSVQMSMDYMDTLYKIKIYPRLVHVIKSFNSRIQGEPITNIRGVGKRIKASVQMVQLLSKVPVQDMGGYRIEVTVQAPSLDIAMQWVDRTPYLNIHYWSCPGQSGHKLDILVTDKQHLLHNSNWVIQRLSTLDIVQGRDSNNPNKVQRQAAADVLASFGWNAGREKPTRSLDTTAWWTGRVQGTHGHVQRTLPSQEQQEDLEIVKVLSYLQRNFNNKEKTTKLLSILRTKSVLGHVPCQKDKLHQYIIAAWNPFRLRCSTYKCRDNLNAGNAFRWFATLIVQGHVPRTSVGLPADMSTDADTRVDIGLDRLRVSPTFDLD
jgi:hypothetical protein